MIEASFQKRSAARRIIIVEHDPELRNSLVKFLEVLGYELVAVGSALEFYRMIDQYDCCLAIMDIELPDQDGLVLVEYLKKNTDIWIVMLTQRRTVDVRLSYYRAGADVLLEKPVDFRELAAVLGNLFQRIDKAKRLKNSNGLSSERSSAGQEMIGESVVTWKILSDGWLLISPQGESIELTLKEFKFLTTLSETDAIAVSRKELLQTLEYQNDEYGNRALESLVHRLRSKTATLGSSPIKTAHGIGYSFAAPVGVV